MSGNEKYSKEKALQQLKYICSRMEKSRFHIWQKLCSWHMEKYAEEFSNILEMEGYINEKRFTKAFVNDKWKIQKYGRPKIQYLLKAMNVTDLIISEAISEIDEEAYKQMIESELARKLESLNIQDAYKLRQRLYSFGNQRGYETDHINSILDILIS